MNMRKADTNRMVAMMLLNTIVPQPAMIINDVSCIDISVCAFISLHLPFL